MYHRIVAARVRGVFVEINAGNWQAMVDGMADRFTYRFHGEHALSGVRTTRESLSAWWERCFRLMDSPRFTVTDVIVAGPPWRTRVATALAVSSTLPDGSRYSNVVFQRIEMRWGRVTSVETLEDTRRVEDALAICAAAGMTEALESPIVDE